MTSHKTVKITKSVPVVDRESLIEYLNQQLKVWIGEEKRDKSTSIVCAGLKTIELIEEAGFTITPPRVGVKRGNIKDGI